MVSGRRVGTAKCCIFVVFLVTLLYEGTIDFTLPPRPRIEAHATRHSSLSAPVASTLGILVALAGNILPACADSPGSWNYDKSGTDWGEEYPACNGKAQTPINLKEDAITETYGESLSKLVRYKTIDTDVFNNGGKNLQCNGEFGALLLPDGPYEAKQFHFHFPSEHEINGKLAAGEMHIVHQKKGSKGTDDLAVIGIMLKHSDSSDGPEGVELKKLGIGGYLPQSEGAKLQVPRFNLNSFVSEFGGGFWHYRGSLTTPPCSETVHWYVLKRGMPVTQEMIDSVTDLFPPNNRGSLALNGRPVASSLVALKDEFP